MQRVKRCSSQRNRKYLPSVKARTVFGKRGAGVLPLSRSKGAVPLLSPSPGRWSEHALAAV